MYQKQSPGRNPHYREMARGRECMIKLPGVCCRNPETTVLAHSNQGIHGKGMGLKSGDQYGVWACFTCHQWLDQGKATADAKRLAFDVALERMQTQLQKIATDVLASYKDRQAAMWALNRLIG